MYSMIELDLCFMCTKDYNCVSVDDRIVCQVEYLLPEITIIKLGIPLRICSLCEGALYAFNKFKQFYIESSRRLETNIRAAQYNNDNETSFKEETSDQISLDTQSLTNNETHDTQSEQIEEIFIKEELSQSQNIKTYDEMIQSTTNEVGNDTEVSRDDFWRESSIDSDNENGVKQENFIENIEIETNNSTSITKTSEQVKKRYEYPCTICNKMFYKSYNLKRHMTMHSEKFPCRLCKKSFSSKQDLTSHINNNHSDQNNQTVTEKNESVDADNSKNKYQCTICYKIFLKSSNLKKHLSIHDKQNPCPICQKIFKYKLEMVVHVKTIHPEVTDFATFEKESNINEENNVQIQIDAESNTNQENSSSQQPNIPLQLQENQCHICLKVFTYVYNLKRHMNIHTEGNKFACHICNKKFARKAYVESHIERIHMRKSKVPCPICNKLFKHHYDMKDHMKLHTGVKNYYCNICDKKLMRKSSLDYHNQIHSGVKDIQCKICNKSFTHLRNLQGHMRYHAEFKPHQCEICKKSFVHKDNLEDHLKVHSGVKDFQCEICNKCFGHKRKLIRHMKVHEKNKNVE